MKETVIRFLGKDLKIKSVCDDFVRLEYSEEFRAPGEFSCTLSLDRAYIPAIGEYALIGESALYVIEGVGRDTGAGTARISGRGILSFFSRRILPVTVKNSCPFDSAVYGLAMAYGMSAFPKSLTVKHEVRVRPFVFEIVISRMQSFVQCCMRFLDNHNDIQRSGIFG